MRIVRLVPAFKYGEYDCPESSDELWFGLKRIHELSRYGLRRQTERTAPERPQNKAVVPVGKCDTKDSTNLVHLDCVAFGREAPIFCLILQFLVYIVPAHQRTDFGEGANFSRARTPQRRGIHRERTFYAASSCTSTRSNDVRPSGASMK